MKKNWRTLAAIAALLAGGVSQAAPVNITSQQNIRSVNTQSKQELPKHTRETKRQILPNGFGGIDIPFVDFGRSPKEYGQYLQRTGKQVWVKSKNKKP